MTTTMTTSQQEHYTCLVVVVVVVECYCFLINIIVDVRRRATPPKTHAFLLLSAKMCPLLTQNDEPENPAFGCCGLFLMNVSHFRPVGLLQIL